MTELWADVSEVEDAATAAALAYVRSSAVSHLLVRPSQLTHWQPLERITVACLVGGDEAGSGPDERVDLLVADSPRAVPAVRAASDGAPVGVRCHIVDGDSMNAAAALCGSVDVLISVFSDETNIPLELLLARAQNSGTAVLKALRAGTEASTVAGVLESGPDGVVVDARRLPDIESAAAALSSVRQEQRKLVPLEVVRSVPVGMGYRGCIDTTTLFDQDEGMIVGSTSSGGFLVCAEVHYLPYMDLRPFRVNAGAVHSYVFGPNETSYITDLRAGRPVSAVSASGRFREELVGRVKVELRPLRLVEATFEGTTVNVFLQDDWHVRVMSGGGEPRNLTEVRPGDSLLGYTCEPGRHVGIKVSERIQEF